MLEFARNGHLCDMYGMVINCDPGSKCVCGVCACVHERELLEDEIKYLCEREKNYFFKI